MKFNHNKKRNTALIYEMLVREITRAMMNESNTKKNANYTDLVFPIDFQ